MKISGKIFTIIAFVFILGAGSTCLISVRLFSQGFMDMMEDNVESSAKAITMVTEKWTSTLETEGKMIAADRQLQIDIDEGNYEDIQQILDIQIAHMESEHVAVATLDGRIVAGNVGVGMNLSDSIMYREALRNGTGYEWYSSAGLPFELLSAVVINRGRRRVGIVFTGFDFTANGRVDYLKSVFNSEITFFRENVRVSTTLTDENGARIVGTTLANPEIENRVLNLGEPVAIDNEMSGTRYRSTYTPLKNADGTPKGIAFIGITREPALATVNRVIRIVLIVFALLLVGIGIVSFLIVRAVIVKPLINLRDSLIEISSGEADLRNRITSHSKDEIGEVVQGFNKFMEKLHEIVRAIKDSNSTLGNHGENVNAISQDTASAITQILANINSVGSQIDDQTNSVDQTAGSVNEISANIESLNKMIEEQSSGISEASAAVEEMIGNISSVNQSVAKMASSFKELHENAEIGFKKQQDVNERVQQIETQSAMLEDANQAIADIAAQTNLLAMNAAIEAAHAGDAGKGFSVVAGEIRKLSETSSGQSRTIGEQLSKIRESIKNVVMASDESSEALGVVSEKIRDTDQLVSQIHLAMEEQTEGSKQISEALKNMNDSSIEVRHASQEMAIGNKVILDEVNNLQNATMSIKDSMTEMTSGAEKINETGSALNDVTAGLKDSINTIGMEINKFTV